LRHKKYLLAAASAAALGGSQSVMASGFAVSLQSAQGLGNAYAGSAAVSDDPSIAFYNPAGIFELDAPSFGVSAGLTAAGTEYTDRGSLIFSGFGAAPVALEPGVGPNENIASNGVSPGIYYARTLSNKWAVGFAFTVPFATASEYDDNWIGRYQAVETSVRAFDLNPSVAYKVNDVFSIGGGISVQFADALLSNKLDSGATCLGIVTAANLPVTTCSDLNLTFNDPSADSNVELDGSGTQVTFNIGALIKPREGTKIGLAYRAGADHELEGNATFDLTNAPGLAAFIGMSPEGMAPLQNTGSTISADLPATFDVAIAQQVTNKLELLGTVQWTQWSSFDQLTSSFDNPAQPESALEFQWEDTFFVSGGLNFDVSEKLTLRAGLALDQTPIPNPTFRSARGPTNDRFWISLGGSYNFNKSLSAHFGYTNLSIDDSAINNPGSAGNPTLRGEYEFEANLFALQINWNFI